MFDTCTLTVFTEITSSSATLPLLRPFVHLPREHHPAPEAVSPSGLPPGWPSSEPAADLARRRERVELLEQRAWRRARGASSRRAGDPRRRPLPVPDASAAVCAAADRLRASRVVRLPQRLPRPHRQVLRP
ncbi:hypothetical protein [Nonomuraea rubra]|uniref:hypothetical protein n=1 Tax=Nonomuraea rubra TaxID=46180 RepID=UPI0031EE7B48